MLIVDRMNTFLFGVVIGLALGFLLMLNSCTTVNIESTYTCSKSPITGETICTPDYVARPIDEFRNPKK